MSSKPCIPVSDPNYWQNPYPILAEFRNKYRTAYYDTGELAVLHWDDAEWAIKGHDFINEGIERLEARGFKPGDPLHTWRSNALGVMEGANHIRVRRLVGSAMSKRNIEPLRPLIREKAQALIDGFPADGQVDILGSYTSILPHLVMMEFLGIEADELLDIQAALQGVNIPDCFGSNVTEDMRSAANHAIRQCMDHVAILYENRRQNPRDDLLTSLLSAQNEQGTLSHDELITLFSTIFGSGGTTGNAIAAGILELTNAPGEADKLRSCPDQWKRGACEETLRMRPGIVELPQKAAHDFSAFGHSFKTGDTISIPLGAPNRDPDRWSDPQNFSIGRNADVFSLTFGLGAHFCLGQAMARYTVEEALAVFVERCSEFEFIEQPRWEAFVIENRLQSLQLRVKLSA